MNNIWWFAIDSMSIFNQQINNLTTYFFEIAIELYEKQIKILRPKNLGKCAEV